LKNKESILIIVVTIIVALLVGAVVRDMVNRKSGRSSTSQPVNHDLRVQDEINMLQRAVQQDPSNRKAWVQLGHAYFDSNQPAQAVEAYDKALAIDPNDADILTDQGNMYRRLGWLDQAIANFRKAQSIAPGHAQSLFNLGVVYRYDLNDIPSARQAWEKFLEYNPVGPGADRIRRELAALDFPGQQLPSK